MDSLVLQMYAQLHNPWRARLRLVTSVAIGASAWTRCPYDAIDYDPVGMATTGVSAQIVIAVAGYYLVSQSVGFTAGGPDGTRFIGECIRTAPGGTPTVDFGAFRFADSAIGSGGSNCTGAGATVWQLGAGDIVTGWGFCGATGQQWNGGSDAEGSTSPQFNTLTVHFLSPV